jgi:predicted metal-binding membrane protein
MALLFVLGVMNLVWIAALAAFVLAEKVIPAGDKVSKLTGAMLVAWGAGAVLAAAF